MANRGIALREWQLDRSDYETDEDFRSAVVNELAAFEHIGERLGIGLVCAPIRRRVGGGWVTAGWVFQTATVPAAKDAQEMVERATEPEPDEDDIYDDAADFDPVTQRD